MSTTTLERPLVGNPTDGGHNRLRSLIRGREEDASWYRPLLIALLAATAIAYIVNLTASGNANSFYAAAVEAGTKSWKAFFFGSIDSSNFITVDKPPASLWVMELSGRIFGFSSASMLIPEVLEGVISIGLLVAAVKRWFGAAAGLMAGLALAVTPVAALMFRFNNPDALMVCLMVGAAYCLVRSIDGRRPIRWMLGVGACLGFAFLAKMMEAFLVVPGFALVYMIAAPVDVRRRVGHLLAGFAAMIFSAGWWVAIVALWPAGSRPYIDGSPDNSILNLIFDYNGLGRLTGNESGTSVSSTGGGGMGANFSGSTGIFRLFNDSMGAQASWLIPAALIVLVAGLIWRGRRMRTDRMRAGLLIWGTWLVVTGICFSFSKGTIHTYYTVALAPPIAALAGIGAAQVWRQRSSAIARGIGALLVAVTAGWAVVLLGRDSSWESWLTPLVIVTGVLAIAGLLIPSRLIPARFAGRVMAAVACLSVIACLAAPMAYTAETIGTAHTGSTPTAGPASSGGFGGGAGGFGGGSGTARGGFGARSSSSTSSTSSTSSSSTSSSSTSRSLPGGTTGGTTGAAAGGTAAAGGAGGGSTTSDSALAKLLESSSGYRWAAATDGSQSAASLELESNGSAVMAIGGFSGLGGEITLAEFEKYVKAGDIHYYIAGSGGGAGGFGGTTTSSDSSTSSSTSSALSTLFNSSNSSSSTSGSAPTGSPSGSSGGAPSGSSGESGFPGGTSGKSGASAGGPGGASSGSESKITAWVEAHYKSETVGGETVYNLSEPKS